MTNNGKPRVLVLGGNFAGLSAAQEIRKYAGDSVDMTLVDRKPYLLYVPNIPAEVFEDCNPQLTRPLRHDVAASDVNSPLCAVVVESDRESPSAAIPCRFSTMWV